MDWLGSLEVLRLSRWFGRLVFFLGALVVLAVLPSAAVSADYSSAKPGRWPECDGRLARQKISFVHVADVHANYNPEGDGGSPVSRLVGFHQAVKKENPFTVLSNAGDDYEKGSIAEELSQGQSTRKVVHAVGYDVRTLGNHDFAWGLEEVLRFSNDPSALVLSSNTWINHQASIPPPELPVGWQDFGVLTVGCVRIGFFGLTARPYDHDGRQHPGPIYPQAPALEMDSDHLGIAQRLIARYRQEVDVLVLVSHLGLAEDIRLAKQTSGIDLILGGHSHNIMKGALQIGNTAIIHVGSHAGHIGRYDISYDLREKTIVDSAFQLVANKRSELPGNADFDPKVAEILSPFHQDLTQKIVELKNDQLRPAIALIAAQAAVRRFQVDAAFVSEGSVWTELQQGALTRQDILNAFRVEREPVGTPGRTSLYLTKIKGADLLRARKVLTDSAYCGPIVINPEAVYSVALQKPQALGQQEFFAGNISLSPPQFIAELWQIVDGYASDLNARNLALDEGKEDQPSKNLLAHLPGEPKRNSIL